MPVFNTIRLQDKPAIIRAVVEEDVLNLNLKAIPVEIHVSEVARLVSVGECSEAGFDLLGHGLILKSDIDNILKNL